MSGIPNLLNDDGTASIATAIMMSHHGFRRDLARFARALENVASGDESKVEALREKWKSFHITLHGHHEAEDNGVFPPIAGQHASVRTTIEALSADHRRIDPLLERGDAALSDLPKTDAALEVVRQLKELLEPHLATEEREIIPFLRDAKSFPPPPNDEAAALCAEGFAWAMQGIASDVLEQVYAMLPEMLLVRIPAACTPSMRAAGASGGPRTQGQPGPPFRINRGRHRIEVLVNGVAYALGAFELRS